ncbi:MAG TPA: transglycosylase SLT domain-containing protein [Caulobacteraceae bacterium]|nr:transglycosylase SLT domain-containing protein [Caulobacteraceae bacterium]
MSVEQIRGVVEAAIQRASSATGVDFGFLMGAARRESGYNPNARARTSSATGLFQFTEQTWLSTLKQHGAKYGYARYSNLIQQGTDGRLYVSGGEARATVLDLRLDPHASALMAGELAADHAAYLRGRVGREPTAGELYVAHVLGPAGSAKLIDAVRAAPTTSAASLFPEAADANRSIFYRGGRPATVAEVYANLTAAPAGGLPVAPATNDQQAQGFVEYASARQRDRQRAEQMAVAMVLRGPESVDDVGMTLQAANGMFSTEMLRALSAGEHEG